MRQDKNIRLRVNPQLHSRIMTRAKKENLSVADVTRSLYDLWLDGHIKFKKPESKLEAVIVGGDHE